MSFDSISSRAERWVARWHDLALLLAYVVFHLPSVLFVKSIQAIQYPLEAIYISRTMFDGFALSKELTAAAAIPANIGILYAPLNYLLSYWLDTVEHLFWFSFVVQAIVPLFAYRLLCTVTSKLNAILLAVFWIVFNIKVQTWAPDILIQPLLLALLYFWNKDGHQVHNTRIITLGLLTAVIGLLKYHEGLILMTAIGGGLMLRLAVSHVTRRASSSVDTLIVTLCFSTVAVVFAKSFLHIDELLYFTLPSIILISSIYYLLSKHNASVLTNPAAVRILLIYTAVALSLPLFSFILFGSELGYSKYFYAVFQMGFDFLPAWDFGIVGLIWDHIGIRIGVWRLAFASTIIAIPLIVNIFIVARLARIANNSALSFAVQCDAMAVGSISVLGIYMLYPLEAYHILISKLGLFIFPLLYFTGQISSIKKWLPVALIVILVPASGLQMAKWWDLREFNVGNPASSLEIKSVVGIPLAKPLSNELTRQIETIKTSVPSGCSYYVIDSTGGSLTGLASFVQNGFRQIYIELRPKFLTSAAVDLVNNQLASVDFVLIQKSDIDNYVSVAGRDTIMAPILSKLHDDFEVVATYTRQDEDKGLEGIVDFVVLQRIARTSTSACFADAGNDT